MSEGIMTVEQDSRTCSDKARACGDENQGKIKSITGGATFGGFMGFGFFGPVGAAIGAGLGAFGGLVAGTVLDSSLCRGNRK